MIELVIPAFIAGLLTFLAPCTLPLVPSYLGFISGVSLTPDNLKDDTIKKRIILNSLLYILGFSFVFVALGSIFSLGGGALAIHRLWLARVGGVFVIIFGLFMLQAIKLPGLNFLNQTKRFNIIKKLQPGKPWSSFIFGSAFAFGWTPCVGPVLGTILLLASTTGGWAAGSILLAVFSLGLALPFFIIALTIDSTLRILPKIYKILPAISVIGGIFLIIIGILMLMNNFGLLIEWFYQIFDFINYQAIIDYL
jgi:cytochrome c-type biogenesis protein